MGGEGSIAGGGLGWSGSGVVWCGVLRGERSRRISYMRLLLTLFLTCVENIIFCFSPGNYHIA